jgi:hypothetical protein
MSDYTVVGIDFGTSTTVVKVRNYYEAGATSSDCHALQFDNSNCLPTLIYEACDGHLYFGKEAQIRKSGEENGSEGRLHDNFKMRLVDEDPETAKKAKELTQNFFEHIYSRFKEERANLGVLPEVRTCISYPVKWDSGTKLFMIECAEKAGFTNAEGADEATAAIYASIPNNLENLQKAGIIYLDKPVNVMMLDMGAGTSDIAIFNFKIGGDGKLVSGDKVTWPPINKNNCGGSEIEGYMSGELENYIKKISKKGEIKENIRKQIKGSVKGWKEDHLSPKLKDRGDVGLPNRLLETVREKQDDGIYENIQFEKIDRQRFESITGEHWKQLRELINGALRSANASKKLSGFTGAGDIDLIILTGGHSKWYGVCEFIKGEKFAGCEPINFTKIRNNPTARILQETSPQETVALGLVKIDEFKKIGFELKPLMGNSMWIKYELLNHCSSPMKIVDQNDVLPIYDLTHTYEFQVELSMFNMEKLPFLCHCYYGENIESAKHFETKSTVQFKNLLLELLKIYIIPFYGTFKNIGDLGRMAGGKEAMKDQYEIKVSSSVNINKYGTIEIEVTVSFRKKSSTDWKACEPFKIELGK